MKLLKISLIVLTITTAYFFILNYPKNSNHYLKLEPSSATNLYALPTISTNDLLNWKYYKSKSFNFSFYYPPNYTVTEETITFSDKKYPILTITDTETSLKLIFNNIKKEPNLNQLGFSTDQFQLLEQKPQVIRKKDGNTWIYYNKSYLDTCVSVDGTYGLKEESEKYSCYDVNFPNNWYYNVYIPETIDSNSVETENALINFDKVVLSLKN